MRGAGCCGEAAGVKRRPGPKPGRNHHKRERGTFMSVAQLTARELGLFAAIAHKHAGQDLAGMIQLAERISAGNCGAWAGTYGDRIEPADDDEVEQWALDYLAGRRDMVDDHFAPLVYNMVSNNGGAYLAPGVTAAEDQGSAVLVAIRAIEDKCKAWQDREARAKRRAEEDAASFDDIGQLPKLQPSEIRERMTTAGATRTPDCKPLTART